MPLFAQADPVTWMAVAISAITTVGAVTTAVLGYMRDRDRLRYDRALAEMGGKIQVCDEDRDKLRTQNGQQQGQINELYRLLGRKPPDPEPEPSPETKS